MSQEITANAETLMRQGSMTAGEYLNKAVEYIDFEFGTGYAKANPQLVAAFVQASASDCNTAIFAQQLRAGLDRIAEAIDGHSG